jgi:hypothetical protein
MLKEGTKLGPYEIISALVAQDTSEFPRPSIHVVA